MNRWEMEKKIVIQALKDSQFKKKLLTHPKEALKELFGDKLMVDQLQIQVREEKKNEWVIAIPHIEMQGQKLSDTELERIAGAGGSPSVSMCLCQDLY
jgi:hypothetical protein